MATLTSTKIKNTYDALLKSIDNDAIGTTAKQITDGLGNTTPLYVSTTQVGIGVTPESGLNLHVFGDAKIGSNLTVIGNLVVEGSTTTVGTDTLTVKDPLIVLANNNTSTDAVDIGFYGKYTPSGTTLYSGLFREALTGKYRLFKGLEDEPTTTVNTSGTGYAVATLVSDLEGTLTGVIASTTTATTQSANDNSTKVATTAYVDNQVGLYDTLSEVLANGNTSGANDIIMEDGQKVNFGTDSDLEMYHDGTDGYIDNINGELILQNNSDDKKIIFKSDNGIGDITEYFRIDGNINRNVITVTTQLNDDVPLIFGDGAARPSIKYDSTATDLIVSTNGSTALTIDTSQNATFSADLIVDTDTLFVDSTNGQVGINNASPSGFTGQYSKDLIIGDGTGDRGITIYSSSLAYGSLFFKDAEGSSTANGGFIAYNHFVDGMEFGIGNAGLGAGSLSIGSTSIFMKKKLIVDATYSTTNTLTVDPSNARVGIFNDSPSYRLDVAGDARFTGQTIVGSDLTVDTDTLFVDASEDSVGIGLTNPADYTADELVISVPDGSGMTLVSGTTDAAYIAFADATSQLNNYIGFDHNTDTMSMNNFNGSIVFSLGEAVNQMTINSAGVTVENDFKAGDLGDPYLLFADVSAATVYIEGELDVNGNLNLADDEGIRLGNSNDLQIYHDSTSNNSFIKETGAGSLQIWCKDFEVYNAGGTETLINADVNAGVQLYYNNVVKFATTSTGVTITGTSIHTGIEIESTSPQILFDETDVTANWRNRVSGGSWRVQYASDGSSFSDQFVVGATNTSFETGANFAGDVGIGTDNPDKLLHISGSGGTAQIKIQRANTNTTGSVGSIGFANDDGYFLAAIETQGDGNDEGGHLIFRTHSDAVSTDNNPYDVTERMRIDSSGNVGINETDPSGYWGQANNIVIDTSGNGGMTIKSTTSGNGRLVFTDTKSATAGNTDGGMIHYKHSDDEMRFQTNGSQKMVIDSSGNVGINETNPAVPLHISRDSASGENIALLLDNNDTTAGNEIGILFRSMVGSANTDFEIFGKANGANDMDLVFQSDGSAERMRITSGGRVGINANAPSTNFQLNSPNAGATVGGTIGATIYGYSNNEMLVLSSRYDQSTGGIRFKRGEAGSEVTSGSITFTASATSYNTSSDYRLKENVVEMTGALDRVSKLKPSRFNFIADADKTVDGFLAHEVQEIVPEAITGEKDGMRTEEYEVSPDVYEDVVHPAEEAVYETVEHPAVEEELDDEGNIVVEGKEAYTEEVLVTEAKEEWTEKVLVTEKVMGTREVPDYQGIDQSKLVPLLVGAIQELKAEIESLKQQINN
jgi:hypothetical protein